MYESVHMNPSTFLWYIPINVELSAHVGVSKKEWLPTAEVWPKQAGGGEGPTLFEQRVGTTMADTALSGVVGVGVWMTLIKGKYLYLCNSQQTCSYSN